MSEQNMDVCDMCGQADETVRERYSETDEVQDIKEDLPLMLCSFCALEIEYELEDVWDEGYFI